MRRRFGFFPFQFHFSFVLLAALINMIAVRSQACVVPELSDFRFYSLSWADVRSSDFQGVTGAGLSIKAEKFLIKASQRYCLGLTSGGSLQIESSQIVGPVEAANRVVLNHVGVEGSVSAPQIKITSSGVAGDLISENRPVVQSAGYRNWLAQLARNQVSHESLENQAFNLTRLLQARRGPQVNCVTLSQNDFSRTPVVAISDEEISRCPQITLRGSQVSQALINILGSHVTLSHLKVILLGGLSPRQVTWNMPWARTLLIQNTADAVYGLPGTVLAPYADTEFYDGLITGSLIVGSLSFDVEKKPNSNTGQINSPDAGECENSQEQR